MNQRIAGVTCTCVVLLSLGALGCGESASQKDARQQHEDAQATQRLNENVRNAARAQIEARIAEARQLEAVARLHRAEGKPSWLHEENAAMALHVRELKYLNHLEAEAP